MTEHSNKTKGRRKSFTNMPIPVGTFLEIDESSNTVAKNSNEFARSLWTTKTTQANRIIMQLARLARTEPEKFPNYRFHYSEIIDSPKLGGKEYDELDRATDELMKAFYVPQQNRKERSFEKFSIVTYCKLKNGFIEAKLNPDMKWHFLDVQRNFTLLDTKIFNKLRGNYYQKFYILISTFQFMKEKTLTLEEIYHALNIASNAAMARYSEFRRHILEPAKTKLPTEANFYFDYIPIKTGRSVSAIHFIFKENIYKKQVAAIQDKQNKQLTAKHQRALKHIVKCYESRQMALTDHYDCQNPTCFKYIQEICFEHIQKSHDQKQMFEDDDLQSIEVSL